MEDARVPYEKNHAVGLRNGGIALGLVLLLLGAVAGCSSSSSDPGWCKTGMIETSSGVVCGKFSEAAGRQIHAFLGIPYGESTAGNNRWQAPLPRRAASGVIDATEFGPSCPQAHDPAFAPSVGMSEDCLRLNIWRRADLPGRDPRPVMIWIYGGSFLSGSSSMPIYDGAYLAATEDVVVVTFNYRLGVLGFLAGIHGLTGNYGLMDQQLAFHWVRENIANFGGDPEKVTIFGESAGAMSVGLHLLSLPSSSGLFRAGIMQSNPFGIPYKTVAEAGSEAAMLEKDLGCEGEGLDCLRSISAEDMVNAQQDVAIQKLSILGLHLAGFLVWAPVLHESFLVQDPTVAAQEGMLTLPAILGTTHDEGIRFVYDMASAFGGKISSITYLAILNLIFGSENTDSIISIYGIDPAADNGDRLSKIMTDYLFGCANRFVAREARADVHTYEFNETSINIWPNIPACEGKACHGDDIPFTFHTDRQIGIEFTEEQARLSDEIMGYWGGFAATLDPNDSGRIAWPPFTPNGREYLILNTPVLEIAVNPIPNCDFWDRIGYDLRPPQP
jgi:carboxylesterase type B